MNLERKHMTTLHYFLAVNADAVLKGTNVSGMYDHISFREVVSRGVTSMDMMAIQYCEENGISG